MTEGQSINQLLRAAAMKLDPLTLAQSITTENERPKQLDRRPPHQLDAKIKNIIAQTKARCEHENFTWPTTPRYPFRVDLNHFAKALASDSANGGVKTFALWNASHNNVLHQLDPNQLRCTILPK